MASAEGAIDPGFEIERDLLAGTITLSQKHYAEGILRTYDAWEWLPSPTLLPPGQRLVKNSHDTPPDRPFHLCYPGIVGSWGCQLG